MNDWHILDLYFKDHKYPFTNHHLDSYRELIKKYIPQTIKTFNPITMIKLDEKKEKEIMKVNIYVGGRDSNELFIDHPITYENGNQRLITPNDARLKSITYETHIYANVLIEIFDEEGDKIENTIKNVAIGSIPIMLHSDICVLNGNGNAVLQRLGECIYDGGGYFIIDGKEKVIIAQESETNNCLITGKLKDDDNFSYKGKIKSSGEIGESVLVPRTIEFYLVKDTDDITEKFIDNKGAIYVNLPSIEGKIPLFIFFRALGIESDKDIYESIFGINNTEIEDKYFSNFIRPSIYNNYYEKDGNKYYIYSQEDALNYLKFRTKYKTIDQVKYIFTVDIFPNIPKFENKGKYLGYLTKEFINVALKIKKESDRDNYFNKRINISGFLLAELFQEAYMKLRKTIRDTLDNFYYFGAWKNTNNYQNFITKDNIYKLIPVVLIANTFAKSLKGRWGLETDDDPELGRVQDLSRISYIGFLSHLRRVNMPIDRTIKITSPHKLHCHQYGIMCPFETPDGAAVGYLKNLAFLTKVAAGTNPQFIRECLLDLGVIPIENYNLKLDRNITKIFVNNSWFGITNDAIKIVRTLKAYRRNALINILTSITWNNLNNEIKIFVESGRAMRPLIIINNENSKLFLNKYNNWFDMIIGKYNKYSKEDKNEEIYYKNEYINPKNLNIDGKNFSKMKDNEILEELEKEGAVIEYIDPQESDSCFISMNKNDLNKFHTHLEIHPSTMLSVVSGNIPMCNHNQSARNVFHAAQTKQAIGIYATNFNKRFDTFGFIQHYPQKAIINTRHSQYTGSDAMANGANLIVAIMTYTGFNQEDSLIINKKSIERGLFHLSYYKSITASTKIISDTEKIIFGNPVKLRNEGIKINGIKHADYNLIDDNGIIREGSYIPRGKNAIIIGMILIKDIYKEIKKGLFIELVKETSYTDVSIISDESYYGYINKVYVGSKTLEDETKVCKVRLMKIKIPEFGDKHSSRHGQKGVIGMILPEEQMPFTKDGIRPDLIVNPHAIPSRMTIGHLVECVYSKLCCLEGYLGDGTTFINLDYNGIYDSLEKHKYNKLGNEILYNGQTGRQINTEIFIGPTYYFRLKHMVAEKLNARGFGPKIQLTRQPTGGRRKAGGLRIGEMERDSLISHGIAGFIKESMMERSDKYRWCVCKNCGIIPVYGNKIKDTYCNNCGKNEINIIETPYSFKLLKQEFEAMGIQMRFNCDYVDIPSQFEDIDEEIDIDTNVDNNEDINEKQIKKLQKIINKKDDPIKPKKDIKDYKKLLKPALIEIVKQLYPSMNGISAKKKEELITLIENSKKEDKKDDDEIKEVKKDDDEIKEVKVGKYTDKECLEWKKNKLKNPITKKPIQEGKPTYNDFKKNCSHIKTPIFEEDKKDDEKEDKKDDEKEDKKELAKDIKDLNKLLRPDLIKIVKELYPNMKAITSKKKEELIKLIKDADEELVKGIIKTGGFIMYNEYYGGSGSEDDSEDDSEGDSDGDSDGDSEGDSEDDSEGDSDGDSEGDSKGGSKDLKKGGISENDTKIIII